MNPYLAKLRLRDETHHPCGPSKPSKPILSVVDYANTTGETGFEGFEGDLSKCLPENEAAADRSRSDPLGRLDRTYSALAARSPEHVPADRWQQAVQDGRRFLAKWGEQAAALGWTPRDLFGLQKSPDQPHPSYRRLSRYDETGLIWLLQGRPVVALTAATAAIENPTGAITVYRRYDKPALGPVGDSLDFNDRPQTRSSPSSTEISAGLPGTPWALERRQRRSAVSRPPHLKALRMLFDLRDYFGRRA